MEITTPIASEVIDKLKIGDKLEISGIIYAGRDAVLPKIFLLAGKGEVPPEIQLGGSVIFHTAVSPAGIGPTTSNKFEIEGSIPVLSKAGVKIHLGKGSLSLNSVQALMEYNSIFAITPPVTALFMDKIRRQKVVAFPEEGMEAFYELEVVCIPAIVAIAHGQSIF